MAELEFYDANEARAFPFQENATPSIALPSEAVVDFGCWLGPAVLWDPGTDTVYLASVSRVGDVFTFRFAATSASLTGHILVFTRNLTDDRWLPEFAAASSPDPEDPLDSESCEEYPAWSGYLATGNLRELATVLLSGQTWTFAADDHVTEPSCLIRLSWPAVTSLNLANDDRTRADNDDCDPLTWAYTIGDTFVSARCLTGDVRWRPGYNAGIELDVTENVVRLLAGVGAGEGEPCELVPLFDSETAPSERELLDGSLGCQDVVRSLNGLAGPRITIAAAGGVTVRNVRVQHKIELALDLSSLLVCYDTSEDSEQL